FRALPIIGNLPAAMTHWPLTARALSATRALIPILVEQVERGRPDVLYNQDPTLIPPDALRRLKRSVKLLAAQIASPLPAPEFLALYDLFLTLFPLWFSRLGEKGIYFRLGFEPAILDRVGKQSRRYSCTFVGGISIHHGRALATLEYLARNIEMDFF